MSNKPFDRTILHELEKPLADDINQLETNFDQTFRFFLAALFADSETGTPLDGFLSTGLQVSSASPADMSVSVTAGLGFQLQSSIEVAIDSVPGLNDLDTYKPIPLLANQAFTVPVAPVGPNSRIDIIEVKAERITTDPSLRQVLDPGLGQFVPDTLDKTLAWALDGRASVVSAPSPSTEPLSYVIGQEGAPGLAPPTSPGYIKIAEIAVGSDVLAITADDVTDFRDPLTERVSSISWPALGGFNLSLVASNLEGGAVDVPLGGVYVIQFGHSLEAGDIIEDIVVIYEKINATLNAVATQVWLNNMDVAAETASLALFSTSNTASVTTQKVYEVSHANGPFTGGPGTYPFVWTEGMAGTIRFDTSAAEERFHSVYAIVRRPTIKRDS